jgi:purine-binding chemotaxis protein CheW
VTILRTDLNASTDCSELTQQVNAYIANIGSRSKSSPTASNSSASHVGRVQSNASKPQQSKSTVPIATTVPRDAGIVAPSNTEQQDQSTQESPSEPAVFETSQYDASLSVGARSFNLDEPNAMDSVKAGDRYMIFSIVGLEFGFPLNLVREVSALPKITPISGESQEVLGVYNLRGEVIPVIDLKKKMGYPPSLAKEPVVIVCDIGRHRIGMLVDNVNSVLSLDPTEIADPRAILQTRTRDIVDFVLKRDKKPILILNLKRTLNLD